MSESSSSNPCPCTKNKWLFLGIGILGLIVAYYGVFGKGLSLAHAHDETAYRPMYSLLLGSAFWFTVLIGMLLMVMMTRMFDADWAPIVRRQWEHFIGALPYVIILGVVPLLLNEEVRKTVWEWMDPEHMLPNGHLVGHDSVLEAKHWYLNNTFFFIRIGIYLAMFSAVPYLLRRWSYAQDRDPQFSYTAKAHNLSVGAILLVSLGMTFMAFDLFMGLTYHWYSTMYGVWFFTACIRASLSFTVLICGALSCKGWLKGLYNRAHMHAIGSLMLAFTVFWAYISFAQYFIIYNANIPEETFWYNMREMVPHTMEQVARLKEAVAAGHSYPKNQWWWVSMGLMFLYFFGPFFALLFYKTKVHRKLFAATAAWILSVSLLDLYWNIIPRQIYTKAAPEHFLVNPFLDWNMTYDAAAIIGLGGVVMFVFLHSASKNKAIPIHDPRILESISYHE